MERHALLIQIIDWYQPLPDSTAPFRLIDGAPKRLPKKLFQYEHYPVARRDELENENSAFAEYGAKHITEDYKVPSTKDTSSDAREAFRF